MPEDWTGRTTVPRGGAGEAAAGASATSLEGRFFGPYQVVSRIGMGGMGVVFKARDTRLDRTVALKTLPLRLAHDTEARQRFEREARAVAALNHPNVCTLHDVGPDYLVIELVDGESLRDWIARRPSLSRCLNCARQILEAIGSAHDAGVVHRDLKPDNIMVRFDGYVKVLDFGLATRTEALDSSQPTAGFAPDVSVRGQILGTPRYMAPEQIRGQEADPRTDLFAFGIVLYEMLTGRHPWPHHQPADALHAILHDEPPTEELRQVVDADLAGIVLRLLRKDPTDRYPSAGAVLEVIAHYMVSPLPPAPRGDAAAAPPTTIAVLPFVFLNDVEAHQALSLGFADALITVLGNVEDIAVAPTSAILRCAPGMDPALACRELGARYTLQGTVQKLGSTWRLSTQLFDAVAQRVTFSEKHEFAIESVFEVQDEIGRRVLESLQSRLPFAAATSRQRYSSDPEAYDMFMKGVRDSYASDAGTLDRAVESLAAAVERDPTFALAHATLSHVAMILHFGVDPREKWLRTAEEHCRRALSLDPALPEAHMARAWLLWSPAKNFQHAEAIAALERALARHPNLERAHNRMSTICAHIGRLEEARIAHERAQRANPRAETGNLETYYWWSGQFERFGGRMEKEFPLLLETRYRDTPAPAYLLVAYVSRPLYLGDLDVAERRATLAVEHHPEEPLLVSLQGMVHARRNRRDAALDCVRSALESPRSFGHTHHTHYQIACVHAVLRDTDKAMDWLEHSAATGFACWPFFLVDPHLQSLLGEPRFVQLVDALRQKYAALEIHRL